MPWLCLEQSGRPQRTLTAQLSSATGPRARTSDFWRIAHIP